MRPVRSSAPFPTGHATASRRAGQQIFAVARRASHLADQHVSVTVPQRRPVHLCDKPHGRLPHTETIRAGLTAERLTDAAGDVSLGTDSAEHGEGLPHDSQVSGNGVSQAQLPRE